MLYTDQALSTWIISLRLTDSIFSHIYRDEISTEPLNVVTLSRPKQTFSPSIVTKAESISVVSKPLSRRALTTSSPIGPRVHTDRMANDTTLLDCSDFDMCPIDTLVSKESIKRTQELDQWSRRWWRPLNLRSPQLLRDGQFFNTWFDLRHMKHNCESLKVA